MPPSRLIGSIKLHPPKVAVHEGLKVDVLAPDGKAYNNRESFAITINSVRGSSKYLQFQSPGRKRIRVVASKRGGGIEVAEATVEVQPAAPRRLTGRASKRLRLSAEWAGVSEHAQLQAQASLDEPALLSLSLPLYVSLSSPKPARRALVEENTTRAVAGGLTAVNLAGVRSRIKAAPAAGPGSNTLRAQPHKYSPADMAAVGLLAGVTYRWDFGDGKVVETASPSVEHDYSAALKADQEYGHFDVKVDVSLLGQIVASAIRTIAVHNLYAFLKTRGWLFPPVEHNRFATLLSKHVFGKIKVKNQETFPLHLTKQRVLLMSNDPDDSGAWLEPEPVNITIKGKGSAEIDVQIARTRIPALATLATVYIHGDAGPSLQVSVRADFDLPLGSGKINWKPPIYGYKKPWPWEIVVDPLEIEALDELVKEGLVSPEVGISAATVKRLAEAGKTSLTRFKSLERAGVARFAIAAGSAGMRSYGRDVVSTVAAPGSIARRGADAPVMRTTSGDIPGVVEGEECEPDNLPDLIPPGFACQLTSETKWVTTPARFVNARKGDIVLSQGGPGGLIGGLLRQVHPPQRYSHSGIMSRNFDEVTHSTASTGWLLDHPNGSIFGDPQPSDGLVPNALKYLWPGVITQSVYDAVVGEDMVAPDNGKTYGLKGFSVLADEGDFEGAWDVVAPLIVKPNPMQETLEMRNKLKQIGGFARGEVGKSHYRFFCYTDPSIGLASTAPDSAGWAKGTYPSVCSSFIWLCLRKNGIKLEAASEPVKHTDLEPDDLTAGAQTNTATMDGLYLYKADERLQAAEWLHQKLEDLVWEKIHAEAGQEVGELVDFFSDIAEDVANQVVNTFATDWSDTAAKDSEDWQNTVDANAVSPDNILNWDSPTFNGLYGFPEPLRYQMAEYRQVTVYKWKKVVHKGDLSGKVLLNTVPVAGAYVQLYDGKFATTGPSGEFILKDILVGDYTISAYKWEAGIYYSKAQSVHIPDGGTSVTIALEAPPEYYRSVRIEGTVKTVDGEVIGANEVDTHNFVETRILGPWKTHDTVSIVRKVGGEVRSELHISLDLTPDLTVHVNFTAKLFEGTTTETDDLEEQMSKSFDVLKDNWGGWQGMKLVNEDTVDDVMYVDFNVWNNVY